MTDHPMRPIEEQLNRWAEQRRSQTGDSFELHPATRNLLQSEVARVHPVRADGSQQSRFLRFSWLWPRFAALAGATVLVVFALVQFQPGSEEKSMQMARVDEAVSRDVVPAVDLRVALEPGEPQALERTLVPPAPEPPAGERARTHARGVADAHAVARRPVEAAPPVEDPGSAFSLGEIATAMPAERPMMERYSPGPAPRSAPSDLETDVAAGTPLQVHPPVAAPLTRTEVSPARKAPAAVAMPALSARFAQVQRERFNLQSPPMPDVLRTFQFEKRNDTVQIIDADGSVYHGTLQPTDQPETVQFVARGTNQSTQKGVVFKGSLQQTTHTLTHPTVTRPDSPPVSPSAGTRDMTQPSLEIVGVATLGDHTRIEIRAVAVDESRRDDGW